MSDEHFTVKGLAFRVRPLTPADSADIAELARWTYNGYDFIVEDFKRWMEMPDSAVRSLGIEFEGPADADAVDADAVDADRAPFFGRLVSIEVALFLDGGATGWIYALRVHPVFRGLSLSSALHRAV